MIGPFEVLPVLVAAVAGYLLGWLWFSALFGKAWMEASDITMGDLEHAKTGMGRIMAMSFGGILAMALALYALLEIAGAETLGEALPLALLVAFGFIVTTRFSDMLYSRHPHWGKKAQTLFFIQAGYGVAQVALMTVIISLF
jgi:hypothetical protein